jgi:hypothetical protein
MLTNDYSESLADLEQEIRDLVNQPRKKQSLFTDLAQWNQVYSALDVIGDTELAINTYLDRVNEPADDGQLYILLYGILQVLVVQQDSVKNLVEALGEKFEKVQTLSEIKEIRNSSIGHPSKRGRNKDEESFNFITRISMSRRGFTLITTYSRNKDTSFKQVDLCQLIRDQRSELRKILTNVKASLKREAMEQKNKYKDEKLEEFFPDAIDYYFDKIAEAIFSDLPNQFGLGVLKIIEDIIQNFKAALEARKIFDAYELADIYEWTEYSLQKVRLFFEDSTTYHLTRKDAYINLSFAHKKIRDLQTIAKEIDEDYST